MIAHWKLGLGAFVLGMITMVAFGYGGRFVLNTILHGGVF